MAFELQVCQSDTMTLSTWLKICAAVSVTSLAGGAYFGHKAFPSVQTHETVKTQTQVKDHIVVQTKTIYLKDGTKEVDTTKTETKDAQTQQETTVAKSVQLNLTRPKWHVSAGVGIDMSLRRFYSLSLERHIVGPIFVGVSADTRQSIGVNVGIEF